MELQIDLGCPQGSDDIKNPTPMELQTDFESPQDDIYIHTPRDIRTDWEYPQGEEKINIRTPR
jgi:hypothetical protein